MMEVYVLVEKKANILLQTLKIVLLAIGVISMVLTIMGLGIFLIFMTVSMLGAYFLHTRKYEYEYSYFDGDVRFAKIINKSSRKCLAGYTMEEVHNIAPINDRSVYKYVNDAKIKVRNLTSGNQDAKVYVMVAKGSGGLELVKFEPDEKYLDAVCIKYGQKVVR